MRKSNRDLRTSMKIGIMMHFGKSIFTTVIGKETNMERYTSTIVSSAQSAIQPAPAILGYLLMGMLLVVSFGCQGTTDAESNPVVGAEAADIDEGDAIDPQAISDAMSESSVKKDLSPAQLMSGIESKRWITPEELPMTLGYVQFVGGQRVGFSRIDIEKSTISVKDLLRVTRFDSLRALTAGASGRINSTLTSIEQNTGLLRSFSLDIEGPTQRSVTDAALTGAIVEVNTTLEQLEEAEGSAENGKVERTRATVPWQEGTWGTLGIQQILRIADLEPGREYTATVLLPRINKIADVQLRVLEPELTTLGGGKTATLPLVETLLTIEDPNQDEPMRTGAKSWFNEDGWIEKTVTLSNPSVLTLRIDSQEIQRLESIATIEKYVSRPIPIVQPKSPIIAPRASDSSEVPVWQVIADKLDPYSLFEDSPRQQRKSSDPRTVELRLNDDEAAGKFGDSQRELWLSAIPNVSVENPLLKSLIDPIAQLNSEEFAEALNQILNSKFKIVPINPEMPSPTEAIQSGQADAIQLAVLAAATLRDRGIPTRLVIGIRVPAKSEVAKLHIWSEALISSKWMAIGQGLEDSTLLRFDSEELNRNDVSIFTTLEKWSRQVSALKRISQK